MDGLDPAPAVLALSSLPAFAIAWLLRRGAAAPGRAPARARLDRNLARLMDALGVVGLAAAGGLAWAGGDRDRTVLVLVAAGLLANALLLAALVSAFRAGRGGR